MDRFLGKANPEARSPAAAPSALGVCVKVSPKQGMLILEARPGGLPPKNKKEVGESVWRFRLFIGCVSPVPPFQSMYNTSALIPSTSSRWCSQRGQRPLSPAHSASPSPSLSLPLPPSLSLSPHPPRAWQRYSNLQLQLLDPVDRRAVVAVDVVPNAARAVRVAHAAHHRRRCTATLNIVVGPFFVLRIPEIYATPLAPWHEPVFVPPPVGCGLAPKISRCVLRIGASGGRRHPSLGHHGRRPIRHAHARWGHCLRHAGQPRGHRRRESLPRVLG